VHQVDIAKGTDRKATAIAAQWPEYVRTFEPAARALRALKDTQYKLDAADDKCKADAASLREKMKQYLDAHDPDGLTELPERARQLGDHYRAAVGAMDQFRSTVTGLKSTVEGYDPRDDRWGNIKSNLRSSATAIYEYWDKQTQRVHAECDALARGDRNPEVEKFISDLGGTTSNELATYQKDAGAWEAAARDIYTLDCKDMQTLWDAWCTVEFEPNEEPEESAIERETTDIISAESSKIDAVLQRLPPLVQTGQKLQAKAKFRDAAGAILAELDKQKGRLERLKRKNGDWRGNNNPALQAKAKFRDAAGAILAELDKQKGRLERLKRKNGDWRGNNNPALQFAKTYGVQQHDRMNSDNRCNLYDRSGFPGLGRGRPDCVVVNGRGSCWVYEFKPRGYAGKDRLPDYLKAVTEYYQERMRRNEDASSDLGGHEFQTLVEANCRVDPSKPKKDDEVKFESTTKFYDRCARRYECEQ
jgi:hypothetical protein